MSPTARVIARFYIFFKKKNESGSPRPRLGRFVRVGLVSPYVVVYRHIPGDDLIAIIRIVHGATPDHPPHPDATGHAPMIYGYARVSTDAQDLIN